MGRQATPLQRLLSRSAPLLLVLFVITGEVGGALGVRNCLLSRQQCADDPACRSILDIIPRVCGPESVACSTVTVNKCLAALRTLQGFPYFQPTCLCREPHLDRECNTFHEFIFDHPCSFVEKNTGASPYAVHALPTCEYALRACETLPGCIPLYNNFRQECRVTNDMCEMKNSEKCLGAWTQLKMSPMFGCICPNDHEKRKCTQIFNMVHQNPCVDTFPVSSSAPNLVVLGVGGQANGKGELWSIMFPPPPPSPRPSQRSHPRPHPHPHPRPHLPPRPPPQLPPPLQMPAPPIYTDNTMITTNSNSHPANTNHPYHYLPPSPHATPPPMFTPAFLTALPPPLYASQTQNVLSVAVPTAHNNPFWSFPPVNVIPRVNASTRQRGGFGGQSGMMINPLIVPPYSSTSNRPSSGGDSLPYNGGGSSRAGGHRSRTDNSRAASVLGSSGWQVPASAISSSSSSKSAAAAVAAASPQQSLTSSRREPIASLTMTCQTSLVDCMADRKCKRLMDGVLATCDANQCNQEACMDNLQKFYRNVDTKWAMDVAFCLCKRSSLTADDCLAAQERLHPTCARKPAEPAPLLCHRLAATCKEDASCRHRLEYYEQACAVDSDTQRCAGSSAECRRAVTGILGTELRVLCSCASTDTRETYVCMDWQRILWFNPCVVESQTDYHHEMIRGLSPGIELTTTPNIVYSPRLTTEVLSEPVQHGGGSSSQQAHQGGAAMPPGITPPSGGGQDWHPKTLPPTTTTTRRPTTTTLPPNFCEKHYPSRQVSQDQIVEGGGKRYYTVDDPSCSELCLCHTGKQLVCNVLQCVEARPCETSVAIYIHAAPAFMAYRGECLCYSGSFICVRPHQTMYETGEGVFLFIGFSQAEEELLNPYTHLSVEDTVPRLQILLEEAAHEINESCCQLSLHDKLSQNVILQVTLPELDEHRENMTADMLNKEKDECEDSLKMVAEKINTQDTAVRSNIALSMLMLAEVHTNVPPMPAGAATPGAALATTLMAALLPTLASLVLDRRLFCPLTSL